MVQTLCTCQQRMNGSVLKGEKMTTRRRPGLPAVCRCLPSDKSEASGEARERGGTWRWRGRQSHSLCVIWENLQINTNNSLVLWAPPPPTPSHPHHHSPPLPSLPSLSFIHSLTFSPSPVLLFMALFKLLSGEEDVLLSGVIRAGRMRVKWESKSEIMKKIKMDAEMQKVGCRKYVSWHLGGGAGGGHDYPPFHRRALWLCNGWINLYSGFTLRDPLTDISVSKWGLKVHGGGPRVWVELRHTAHTRIWLLPWTVSLHQYTELKLTYKEVAQFHLCHSRDVVL